MTEDKEEVAVPDGKLREIIQQAWKGIKTFDFRFDEENKILTIRPASCDLSTAQLEGEQL